MLDRGQCVDDTDCIHLAQFWVHRPEMLIVPEAVVRGGDIHPNPPVWDTQIKSSAVSPTMLCENPEAFQFLQGMEVIDVEGGHPLVPGCAEPPFDPGLCCGGVGSAVIEGGADACGKQFHLFILIGASVIGVMPISA